MFRYHFFLARWARSMVLSRRNIFHVKQHKFKRGKILLRYIAARVPVCKTSIGHIRKPPREDKYKTLKTQLIRNLNNSKSNRIHQLTKRRELGGRTPSELLHDMQDGMQTAEYRRSSCAFFARIIYSWRQELSLAKWTCRQKNLQYIFDTW